MAHDHAPNAQGRQTAEEDHCSHSCGGGSSCQSIPPLSPCSLDEALQRFRKEAQRGICDTGRYRCPYFVWGSGPALLIIPGLSDEALSFVTVSALLADRFRCISYNLPAGDGDGARLGRYKHPDLADDVFALLDHLGIRQSYVLGSSFGSTIALAALRLHPERLPRSVLQGGFARRPLSTAEKRLAYWARYWPGKMRMLPFRREIMRRAHGEPFAARPPEVWEFFLERWGAPPIAAVARRALMLPRLDLRPMLPGIRQPVLLVCGDADPLVNRECEQDLLGGLPNAGRVELSHCGHNPQFTHPEAFADVVRRFLTPGTCLSEFRNTVHVSRET